MIEIIGRVVSLVWSAFDIPFFDTGLTFKAVFLILLGFIIAVPLLFSFFGGGKG